MARTRRKAQPLKVRMETLGWKLGISGIVILAMPLFVTQPFLATLARNLRPLGGLALLIGVGLYVFLAKVLPAMKEQDEKRPGTMVPLRSNDSPAQPAPGPTPAPTPTPAPATSTATASPAKTAAKGMAQPIESGPPVRPTSWSRDVFEVIEWRRFEAVVETMFKQAGFETRAQSHGADGGVDVWLYSRHQPGGPISLVQCKHWQGRPVGVDKVRELRGVMAAENVKRGQFATTSTFTPDAEAFASKNGIHLLDIDKLLTLIASRTPAQQAELLDVALEGEYWRPTCASCGTKMVERRPANGSAAFWGCVSYPRCRSKLYIRSQ